MPSFLTARRPQQSISSVKSMMMQAHEAASRKAGEQQKCLHARKCGGPKISSPPEVHESNKNNPTHTGTYTLSNSAQPFAVLHKH